MSLAKYYLDSAGNDSWRVEKITRFSSDYGFINKRMPVHAVYLDTESTDGLRSTGTIFVETATGALASRTSGASRLESWSFSYLHKWQFFDPLSKNLRDVLLVITMLAIVGLSLLGMLVSLRPREN